MNAPIWKDKYINFRSFQLHHLKETYSDYANALDLETQLSLTELNLFELINKILETAPKDSTLYQDAYDTLAGRTDEIAIALLQKYDQSQELPHIHSLLI